MRACIVALGRMLGAKRVSRSLLSGFMTFEMDVGLMVRALLGWHQAGVKG